MSNTEASLLVQRAALEELGERFNEIAERHGLDATDAVLVALNQCASTAANQYVRGESKKEFRRKMLTAMDDLLKHYLPKIEA